MDSIDDEHPITLPAAVLWDMDGTLLDTEPYWMSGEWQLVEQFGGTWSDEHAHAIIGADLLDAAEYIRRHGGVRLPAADIVERLLDHVIAQLEIDVPWRPGAVELLASLQALDVPCGLVTMSYRRLVTPVLAALPAGSFGAIVTGDEVPPGQGKPHPTPYLLGAAAFGVDPSACVAIEDSPTGARSALAAGCAVLGVPNVRDIAPEPGMTLRSTLAGVTVADLAALLPAAV
ncbi:MAG: HAD family phosphatase [Ilumatobacteraceae bacterium]